MAEYDELLARLDNPDYNYGHGMFPSRETVAAAIRAQAKRIAELEGERNDARKIAPDAREEIARQYQRAEKAEARLYILEKHRGSADAVYQVIGWPDAYRAGTRVIPKEAFIAAMLAARMEGTKEEREACADMIELMSYETSQITVSSFNAICRNASQRIRSRTAEDAVK